MKTAVIGAGLNIKAGELLRLEKDNIFGKVNVIKPNIGRVGVVSPLKYEDCIPSSVVLDTFEDCTYVVAGKKQGIFLLCDVIIPVDFSYKLMRATQSTMRE